MKFLRKLREFFALNSVEDYLKHSTNSSDLEKRFREILGGKNGWY